MRHLAALALAALLGCASSASTVDTAGTPESVRIQGSGGAATITRITSNTAMTLYAATTLDSAWNALPAVFAALEIPVTTTQPREYTLGGESVKVRRSLGKVPLSRYLDCGQTAGNSPNADMYDVFLTVVTQLREDQKKGVAISTSVQGLARSPNLTNNTSTCASTGTLEQRIATLLRERVKG
jgi:hypothetical protein